MRLRKAIVPTHETAQEWWESLGNHWTDDREQVVHPVCGWDELDTFEPASKVQDAAWTYAQDAKKDALELQDALEDALATWRNGDRDACIEALNDAERIEFRYGDAPAARALRGQLLETVEAPDPEELAILVTRDGWDTDVDDWTEYLAHRGKLEGWDDFGAKDARELAEATIAWARETQDNGGLTVDFEGLSIVSGEDAGPGTIAPYRDLPTIGALRARLDLERCGGDRWAYALDSDGTRYDFDLDAGAT